MRRQCQCQCQCQCALLGRDGRLRPGQRKGERQGTLFDDATSTDMRFTDDKISDHEQTICPAPGPIRNPDKTQPDTTRSTL